MLFERGIFPIRIYVRVRDASASRLSSFVRKLAGQGERGAFDPRWNGQQQRLCLLFHSRQAPMLLRLFFISCLFIILVEHSVMRARADVERCERVFAGGGIAPGRN